MIERHYSHLTPRLKKDMLTGKRYELSRDEFEDQYDTNKYNEQHVGGKQTFAAICIEVCYADFPDHSLSLNKSPLPVQGDQTRPCKVFLANSTDDMSEKRMLNANFFSETK